VQRARAPRLLEVDLAAAPVGDDGATDGARGLEDHLAGPVGHRVVVAVRLVELEHRELGEVRLSMPSLRKILPISKTRSIPPPRPA
jgi:hypothetical protein